MAEMTRALAKIQFEAGRGVRTAVWREKLDIIDECRSLIRQLEGEPKIAFGGEDESSELDEEVRMDAFRNWLVKNGVELSCVDFKYIKELGCNGVVCTDALEEGKTAFTVPRKLMITVEAVARSQSKRNIVGEILRTDGLVRRVPSMALALALLVEVARGDKSFFKPYLDILPRSFENMPMNWTTEQLNGVENTEVGRQASQRALNSFMYYCHVEPRLRASMPKLNYATFAWALQIAMTRQNPVPLEGNPAQHGLALIPVFDMCNHDEGKNDATFDMATDTLQSKSMRNFAKDEEYRIFYGPRPNDTLLVYAGFCMAPGANKHDVVIDEIGLRSEDPLLMLKLKFTEQCRLDGSLPFMLDEKSKSMQIARLAVADKSQVTQLLRAQQTHPKDAPEPFIISTISEENEAQAYAYLVERASETLNRVESQLKNAVLESDLEAKSSGAEASQDSEESETKPKVLNPLSKVYLESQIATLKSFIEQAKEKVSK